VQIRVYIPPRSARNLMIEAVCIHCRQLEKNINARQTQTRLLRDQETFVVTNRGISLPRDFQNCPGMGKNTIPGLFLEVAFFGLK